MTTPVLLTTDPIPRLSLDEWRNAGAGSVSASAVVSPLPPLTQPFRLHSGQVLRGQTFQLPSLKSAIGNGTWGSPYGYKYGGGWIIVDNAQDWLIEDCVFEAVNYPKYVHNSEEGFNFIHVIGGSSKGVIRRCTFKHMDTAIFLRGGSHHITVEDCTISSSRKSWESDPTFQVGHYGIHLGASCHHNLVSRVTVQTRLMHDVSVQDGAAYNVVEDCTGVDLNFDHHRQNPHHNLFTGCNLGAGTRPFTSSGNVSSGPNNGDWEVFWGNYKADGSQVSALPNFANGYWTKKLVIIGQTQDARTVSAEWYEAIPSASLTPRNLYRYLVDGTPAPSPTPVLDIRDRVKEALMTGRPMTEEEAEWVVLGLQ